MNVGELKQLLEQYPDDMVILNSRCSDYAIIDVDEWRIVMGVEQGGWVMRSHPTMSKENKLKEKAYLHLEGN